MKKEATIIPDFEIPDTNFWLCAYYKKEALKIIARDIAALSGKVVDLRHVAAFHEAIEAHVQQYDDFFVLKIACDELHRSFREQADSVFRVGDNSLVNVKNRQSKDPNNAVAKAFQNTLHKFMLMRKEQ